MDIIHFPSPEQAELECPIAWPERMPEPGIYPQVPWEEYRAWGGISQSILKLGMGTTWGHAKAMIDGEWKQETTDALRFGSAVHTWLLEPALFADRFKISGPCQATLKSGDRKGECCGGRSEFSDGRVWLCGRHAGKDAQRVRDIVSDGELAQIRSMEAAIEAHPATALMRHPGGQEVSFCCELEGVPFRGRADRYCPATGSAPAVVLDLKKIQPGRGTPEMLKKSIRDYGYDIQAACYVQAFENLTGSRPAFVWLFVEDNAPHMIAPVRATDAMLALGWSKAIYGLAQARDCLSSGIWPGYDSDLHELEPDQWELKKWNLAQYVVITGEG